MTRLRVESTIAIYGGSSTKPAAACELLRVAQQGCGKGLGKAPMRKAEDEARRRGMRNVSVNCFGFQASGFCRKLGCREFGKLKDFPAGYDWHWSTKAL